MSGALVAQAINESVGTPGFQGIDAILKEYLGLIAEQAGTARVPISRTINGHSLASDVDLTNDDVGAAPALTTLTYRGAIRGDTDFNTITATGWYWVNTWSGSGGTNYPPNRIGMMLVLCRPELDILTQVCIGQSNGMCVRSYSENAWDEWEWVNPTMQVGVEYRTTERWQGKPVYTKLINFGALPNNTFKNMPGGAGYENVSLDGFASNGTYFYPISNLQGVVSFYYNKSTGNIGITTNADLSANTSAYIVMRYTKS